MKRLQLLYLLVPALLYEIFGGMGLLLILGGLIGVGFLIFYAQKWSELRALRRKYADEDTVQLISRGRLWIGQTAEQVVDAIGEPDGVSHAWGKQSGFAVWTYDLDLGRCLRVRIDHEVVADWKVAEPPASGSEDCT
jgi:hypothetical protein